MKKDIIFLTDTREFYQISKFKAKSLEAVHIKQRTKIEAEYILFKLGDTKARYFIEFNLSSPVESDDSLFCKLRSNNGHPVNTIITDKCINKNILKITYIQPIDIPVRTPIPHPPISPATTCNSKSQVFLPYRGKTK